ncbi:hypothetical protein J6590_033318 [Homalodisca vitripennis]|nr:hypothetical protein J6590_033318 [Homalodisca vitripennis]
MFATHLSVTLAFERSTIDYIVRSPLLYDWGVHSLATLQAQYLVPSAIRIWSGDDSKTTPENVHLQPVIRHIVRYSVADTNPILNRRCPKWYNEQNGTTVPCSRVASDLLSLSLIKGHGPLRKHLHRVCIIREDPLCTMCDEQEKTAEYLLFDCTAIARERYAICGSLDKGGEYSQEDLTGCFRRFMELLKS